MNTASTSSPAPGSSSSSSDSTPSETELRKTLQHLKQQLKMTQAGLTKSVAQIDILHATQSRIVSQLRQEHRRTAATPSSPTIQAQRDTVSALLATTHATNVQRNLIISNVEHTRHLLKARFEKQTKLRTRLAPLYKTNVGKKVAPALPSRTKDPALALRRHLSDKSTVELVERWSHHIWSTSEQALVHTLALSNSSEEIKTAKQQAVDILCDAMIARAVDAVRTPTTREHCPTT
jgi:hypothetical protein